MEDGFKTFEQNYFYVQIALSGVLALSLVLRIAIFNLFKEKVNNLTMDKFLTIDVLFAAVSVGVFFMINLFHFAYPKIFYDNEFVPKKDLLDYCVCIVLILNYGRFVYLFLVIDQLS